MENQDSWSNALGYGFWCGRNCSSRARKGKDAASDAVLAQAALEQTRNSAKEDSWSPMAVAGVVGASLLGIAIMVVIIVRAKKK